MPERSRRYMDKLGEKDRLLVRIVTNGRLVTDYSVQHETFVDGAWHKIARYDSAHGRPHRHIFRLDGSQHVQNLPVIGFNQALTHAITTIHDNFLRTRESYIISKHRRKQ